MSSHEPEIDRKYVLVPIAGPQTACVSYQRFDDGSALAHIDETYARYKGYPERYGGGWIIAEGSTMAWSSLWRDLAADEMVQLGEAKAKSLVPRDWQPPTPPSLPDEAP